MKPIILSFTALALCFAAAGPAAADTACFDWSCNETTGLCRFDLSCSEATPFIWKYRLDFGGGVSTGLTSTTTVFHTYALPNFAYPVVRLTVFPWSSQPAPTVSCQIVVRNVVGPTSPTSGRCSG